MSILMILAAALTSVAVVSGLVGLVRWYRREWIATWRGHRIVVRNEAFREQLWVDGRLVHQTSGDLERATLIGTVEDGGRKVPIMATLGGIPLRIQVFVDGESVALTEGRVGEFAPAGGQTIAKPPAATAAAREPKDSRWAAVAKLLRAIRAGAAESDGDLQHLCDQAEARLRAVLLEIEELAGAVQAHAALGGEVGAGALQEILAAREADAKALFSAIQRLHINAVAGTHDEDSKKTRELLAQLAAEAEVASAGEGSARVSAQARAAQAKRVAATGG